MKYQPPPPPDNLDYSYFGALRNKGSDFKPLNASINDGQNKNYDKIIYDDVTQKTAKKKEGNTQMNGNYGAVYQNNPIDVYSQFGALRPKE
jgi:hypothetical protein